MSAGELGVIGPVSVRYAAQIRELLFAQAMQRMAADQEAARAQTQADRATRIEAAATAEEARQPLQARIANMERVEPSQAPAELKPVIRPGPAHLVDIQA